MATVPLLKRISTLAAKVETTVGTPIALSATDGTVNTYNLAIQPEITVEEREDPAGFNRRVGAPGARSGTVTFTTDIQWDGTATPAPWASLFFPSCGWTLSTSTFTPASGAVDASGALKSMTIGMYEDGVFKSIAGALGNFEIVLESGKSGIINWTFQGVWQAPTDVAIIDPTYSTDALERFAGGACTWQGVAQTVQQVTINSGNEITMRQDAADASGYKSAVITDRAPTITLNPEAEKIAADDRHGDWIASTVGALSVSLGSTLTFSAPKAQLMDVQGADREKVLTNDLTFLCTKNAATKDEELSVVFA